MKWHRWLSRCSATVKQHWHRVLLLLDLGIGVVYLSFGDAPYLIIGVLYLATVGLRWYAHGS